jgi:phospholipid/cholesterol/gamma-HCH transport system permease protein
MTASKARRPPSLLPIAASHQSSGPLAWLESWSKSVVGFLAHAGEMSMLLAQTVRVLFARPFEFREVVRQIERLGIRAMGLVVFTSSMMGMVMAMQFAFGLQKFGGMEYTSRLVALSFVQEIAPTFMGLIVGARIAAGITAELGAMAVTEQVDAISALGASPYKKLVVPRLLACVCTMPVVNVISFALGFCAAMFVTDLQFGIPWGFFLSSALQSVSVQDFYAGAIKPPVFGVIIVVVSCHFGMRTRGGTAGVGRATTTAVVTTGVVTLIADFLLTTVGQIVWPVR